VRLAFFLPDQPTDLSALIEGFEARRTFRCGGAFAGEERGETFMKNESEVTLGFVGELHEVMIKKRLAQLLDAGCEATEDLWHVTVIIAWSVEEE